MNEYDMPLENNFEQYITLTPKKPRTEALLTLKSKIERRNNESLLNEIKDRTGGYYKETTTRAVYCWGQPAIDEQRSASALKREEIKREAKRKQAQEMESR